MITSNLEYFNFIKEGKIIDNQYIYKLDYRNVQITHIGNIFPTEPKENKDVITP